MMEKTLRRLCKKHGLTAISIGFMPRHEPRAVSVYVHLLDECSSGYGATFDEAFAAALGEMNERLARRSETVEAA